MHQQQPQSLESAAVLVTVTGPISSGKSSLLVNVWKQLVHNQQQQQLLVVYGMIQQGVFNNDVDDNQVKKVGYNMTLIHNDSSRELPFISPNPQFNSSQPISNDNRRWVFDHSVFDQCVDHFTQIQLTRKSVEQPTVVVFIDEIGWKEHEELGHWPLIQSTFNHHCHETLVYYIVSIRSEIELEMINKLKQLLIYQNIHHIPIHLTHNNNTSCGNEIIELILRDHCVNSLSESL